MDDLKPRGVLRLGDALRQRFVAHGQLLAHDLHGSNGAGGVVELKRALQGRQRQINFQAAVVGLPLPAINAGEIGKLVVELQQFCANVFSVLPQRMRRRVLPKNGGLACAENARFFFGDLLQCVAQIGLVFQVHAGNNGAVGIKNIHRIQPPAQAYFQNHHIHLMQPENIHRCQGVKFKIGERHIATRGFNALKRGNNVVIAHGLAVDGDAFVKAQQMRAGERANFVARCGVDVRQKSAG